MLFVLWASEHLRTSLNLFSATCSPRHAGTHRTSVDTHLGLAIFSSPAFLTATAGNWTRILDIFETATFLCTIWSRIGLPAFTCLVCCRLNL